LSEHSQPRKDCQMNQTEVYIVTTGQRNFGFNPELKPEGIEQAKLIQMKLLPRVHRPSLVVVGTGRIHEETYKVLYPSLVAVPIQRSLFCGSADSREPNGTIALADGSYVAEKDFIGIGDRRFDAWRVVNNLPPNTLLIAWPELMQNLTTVGEEGRLYVLKPSTERFHEVTSG